MQLKRPKSRKLDAAERRGLVAAEDHAHNELAYQFCKRLAMFRRNSG
jgi:hypothetical protein